MTSQRHEAHWMLGTVMWGKVRVVTISAAAGVGMLNRGRLQYFGIQQPADWQSLPNLAVVPLDTDLLVVKDTRQDCRSVL